MDCKLVNATEAHKYFGSDFYNRSAMFYYNKLSMFKICVSDLTFCMWTLCNKDVKYI